MESDFQWVATLSDGTTKREHEGEYAIVPGERKPWVRLTRFLNDSGLHLTGLTLKFRDREVHMPEDQFQKLSMNGAKIVAPTSYSLQYMMEKELYGGQAETYFVDLIAHYPEFEVHLVQNVSSGNESWVTVTQGFQSMAQTPLK